MRHEDIQEVSENSWFAWSKHVLMQLENDSRCIAAMKRDLSQIKQDQAVLKEKTRQLTVFWGVIGGAIPAAVILAVAIIIWIVRK